MLEVLPYPRAVKFSTAVPRIWAILLKKPLLETNEQIKEIKQQASFLGTEMANNGQYL